MRISKPLVYFAVFSEVFLQLLFKQLGFGIPNRGISFGLVSGAPMIFLIFGLILFLLVSWDRRSELWWTLMFSGSFANLTTRMVSGGQVWDYIPVFSLWFNGADLLINLGIVMLIWKSISCGKTRT